MNNTAVCYIFEATTHQMAGPGHGHPQFPSLLGLQEPRTTEQRCGYWMKTPSALKCFAGLWNSWVETSLLWVWWPQTSGCSSQYHSHQLTAPHPLAGSITLDDESLKTIFMMVVLITKPAPVCWMSTVVQEWWLTLHSLIIPFILFPYYKSTVW